MVIIIISITAFVIMLMFPILYSLFFLRRSDGKVLEIEQSKIKDPRYFVKSFTALFDQKWSNYDGSGNIFLSREENILEADGLTEYPSVCHSVVYAENLEFRPQAGIRFEKEVYARQNVHLYGVETIRAICSKKNLVLGSGTQVLRWVDAEGTLTAFDGCDLGISASSTTKILIGINCRFRRLYAPTILFGQVHGEESLINDHSQNIDLELIALNRFRNIKYVNDDLADAAGALTGSIITIHDITVLNNLTVKGHIRSHKSIRLCDHAAVYGNLFAEEDIYLGQNARVYGSVFTQGSLYAERGVSIGQHGKTKSVIARGRIVFDKNCCVYGYVSSETGGECCPDNNLTKTNTAILPAFSRLRTGKVCLVNRLLPSVISTAVLLAVVTTSISATLILKKVQDNERLLREKQTAAKKLTYGVDSKPEGFQLETDPMLVTKDHVYFKDRVLERFHYDANNILQFSEVISNVMASLPDGVNKYMMLIPMRISLEDDKYQLYSDDINGAIAEIYAKMSPEVTTLDAAGVLYKNRDKYLFFRTDHVWTALGAYYAAKEFCKSTGIGMKDIREYQENRFEKYLGTMYALPNAQTLNEYPDYVSYYILKGAANKQTITTRRARDDYITFSTPTVALSRLGYDIFIGSYFSHSILQGDAKSGKTLMILGDEYSKALAPWLTPYYKSVLLINPRFFNGGSKEFWKLFLEYQINDFLVVEYIKNIGDSRTNAKIREICLTP